MAETQDGFTSKLKTEEIVDDEEKKEQMNTDRPGHEEIIETSQGSRISRTDRKKIHTIESVNEIHSKLDLEEQKTPLNEKRILIQNRSDFPSP